MWPGARSVTTALHHGRPHVTDARCAPTPRDHVTDAPAPPAAACPSRRGGESRPSPLGWGPQGTMTDFPQYPT